MEPSTVRLRALSGRPLADVKIRAIVEAAANAIAERNGVRVLGLATDEVSLTIALDTDKLAALGFLAELRRLTNAWYQGKHKAGPLWGELPPADDEWHPSYDAP